MSSSNAVVKAKTASRQPVSALRTALHDFEAILSDDQKQRLYSDLGKPDANAVINFATEIDSNAGSGRTRCLGQRLITPLNAVHEFSEIVDTFVSSYPQIAALVWGGVKLALLAANNVASYFEKISTLFMNIGAICPQFDKFGALYPDSKELQTALCNYYAAIIRLFRYSLLASRKSVTLRRIIASVRSFEIEFSPYVEDLKRLSEEVKSAIALASQESQVDQAKHNRRALSALRAKARRDDRSAEELRVAKSRKELERKRMRALETLSTYNHEKSYQQNRNECLPGTCAWVCENSTFKAWLKERSKVLWCTGKLGSGKSVISTCVIAHVFKEMSPNDAASYFFCRHDDEESLKARTIVGSIARQLVEKLPLSKFEVLEYDVTTDVKAIIASLATKLSKQHGYFILLDGLDECEKGQAKEVIEAFNDLMKSPSLQIKVYCSGRPVLLSWLPQSVQLQQHIDLETAENQSYRARDIASVINGTLTKRLQGERPELKIGDQKLVLVIQDRLREGAQGMFLWVKFQLLTLCAKKTDESILAALQDLPKDLRETFERILRRLVETDDTKIGRKIFRWAAVAKRPLTIDELREAIAIKPLQKKWDSRKLVNNMIEDAITCCGNLIFLDEEYQTIHFTHSSVKQYLTSQAVDKSLDHYRIDLDHANAEAGAICVTYLNLPKSSNQLAPRADVNKNLTKIPSTVISKSLPNSILPNRLALALLSPDEGSDNAIRRRLMEAYGDTQEMRSQSDPRQHSFDTYAKRFWLEHTNQKIDCESSQELWNLWLNLLQETDSDYLSSTSWTSEDLKNRTSDVLTWILEHNHCSLAQLIMSSEIWPTFDGLRLLILGAAERGYTELVKISVDTGYLEKSLLDLALQSAAMFGNLEIVNILLSGGANVNAYPSSNGTALQAAAGGGHSDVVERLLHENADINAESISIDGRTALQAAAEGGHLPVVMRLLEGEVEVEVNAEPCHWNGMTALQAAAGNGHLAVLTILLDHDADVNAAAGISGGSTALQAAAGNGHLTIVNTLLEKGANVNAQGSEHGGRTALQAAAEHGHLTIVNTLLEEGADVHAEASRFDGKTALQAAAGHGNLTVIERLLEKGATLNEPADQDAAKTVLQAAVESGHLDVVDRILEALENEQVPEMEGLNAPIYGTKGRTALQAAAGKGYLDVVNRLLDKGAYVNAPSSMSSGRTALQAAAEGGYLDIVNRLLDCGADVNDAAGAIGGRTALQAAAEGGYLDVVNRLLDWRADVNAAVGDVDGRTALQAAAGSGDMEMVDLLLLAGANLDAAPGTEDGRTALQAAAEGGHLKMVDRLLSIGAKVDAAPSTSRGRTALQAAAEGGHLKIVDRLLHAGAKVDGAACEKYGKTALEAAQEGGHSKIVERLKKAASQDQPSH